MNWFAIGRPGAAIRMFTRNAAQAQGQLEDGEILVPTSNDSADIIADDGKSVLIAPISLDVAKPQRWAEAKLYRDRIAGGGCSTPSGRVDTDLISCQRINGAVVMAQVAKAAGSDFSINWTMADNTVVVLDADAMIALGVAVGQFVSACQNAGTAIRNEIEAQTNAASVAVVDITAGYPI